MRFKKAVIILLVPLLIEFLSACCNCDNYPFNNYYTDLAYYSHTEMLAYSIDNSGPFSQPVTGDSVSAHNYGIRILLDRQEVVTETPQMAHRPSTFSLLQTAYALECYCPYEVYFEPAEVIDSIHITTLNDFDAFHPAGSDVSGYFLLLWNLNMWTMNQVPDLLNHYQFESGNQAIEFNALLMNAPDPDFPENHGFSIKIFLSDGRILETGTNEKILVQ